MLDRVRKWLWVWVLWYTLKYAYPGTEIFVVIGAALFLIVKAASWVAERPRRRRYRSAPQYRRKLPRDLSSIRMA